MTESVSTPAREQQKNILAKLKEAQAKSGFISQAAINQIAQQYSVSVSEVFGVATFYSFICTEPQGRNVIQICQSVPCYLKESEAVRARLIDILKIRPGETTPDGRFSLYATNCIGACDMAPAMLINGKLHGNLTVDGIQAILDTYR